MSSLTKQIVDELMEKFKNENPDTIIKIIRELRNNIRESSFLKKAVIST